MGQQQLLLLVLGIVIVGLAVVVGIQAFSENQKKANADALVMTGMRIASDAQAWLRKPAAFGGAVTGNGARPADFGTTECALCGNLSLDQLGYPVDTNGDYTDVNGSYSVAIDGTTFEITGTSATTSGAGDNNLVCVRVAGPQATDITTEINPGTGGTPATSC